MAMDGEPVAGLARTAMSRSHALMLAVAALGTITQLGSSVAVTEAARRKKRKRKTTKVPTCPAGTLAHGCACIEAALRPFAATYDNARDICQGEGMRLPTLAELQTFRLVPGQDMSGSFEMTGQI